MLSDTNRSTSYDPLTEIRNGLNDFLSTNFVIKLSLFLARLKVASVWRRFFAEAIDFILFTYIQVIFFSFSSIQKQISRSVFFRILVVFFLSNYFDIIDESRLTLTYMISNFLYDETFSFPIELIIVELGYLIASIAFEVSHFLFNSRVQLIYWFVFRASV